MAEEYDYFFILYLVGFCAEGWLAVLALLHYPSDEHLEVLPDDPNQQLYEVRQRAPYDSKFCISGIVSIISTSLMAWSVT